MDTFSEAYTKLRDVVALQAFEAGWQTFLAEDLNVRGLLAADGPAPANATALDRLRERIAAEGLEKRAETVLNAAKPGPVALVRSGASAAWWALPVADLASRIVGGMGGDGPKAAATVTAAAARAGVGSVADRVAALKMLSHLYRSSKRGAQDVWVYTPPRSYTRWVFDELAGSDEQLKHRLDRHDEVYSVDDRQVMCVALAEAMKWCLDGASKLASPTATTRALVKDWFADQDTTEAQVDAAISTLKDGLKTIAGVCNANTLVFSDEPVDRNKVYNTTTGATGWKDWAFVRPSEPMSVVYIQGAFVKFGATGRTWKCALTIVHEISHRALGNKDLMYDYSGLKPDRSRFPAAKALRNADSWGYFTADLAGMLAPADRHSVLKVAAAKKP